MIALPTVAAYNAAAAGAQCFRCPLQGHVVVPPDPPRRALKLIVIGEGPGRMEERYGRSFVGPSGKMLDAALLEAGGHRQNAWVTNSVLCRQDDDKQLESAIACCAPRLAAEIAALPPTIPILSLGAGASRMTIGKAGIQKYRGFVWKAPEIKPTQIRNAERLWQKRIEKNRSNKDIEKALNSWTILKARLQIQGRTVIPTVHPAFILRGADTWLPVLRGDIKRAIRVSVNPTLRLEDTGDFIKTTSPKEAAKLLRGFSQLVLVDIETDAPDPMRAAITCVGVCDINDPTKIVVMDRRSEDHPWPKGFVAVLKRFLKKRIVGGHNIKNFDEPVLNRYGIFLGGVEDTLVAHRSFASHMPQSLAHVASIYCDTAPWKLKFKTSEEKGAVAGFGVKASDLAAYNAADCRLNAFAWLRMQPDLKREEAVYREDMAMADLYSQMQRTGIRVDTDRQRQLSKKLKHRAAALVGEMRELLRKKSFSPGKTADIRKALYGQLKAPLWLAPPTPTGLPSTAAIVLEALKDHDTRAGKLADFIIRWRSANDSRSEYLDVYVHPDGRVKPSWGQVETGRPRTRNPNILNIPRMEHCTGCGVKLLDGCHHGKSKLVDGVEVFVECKKKEEPQPETQLRDIYVAAIGHRFVYFDLKQAEMVFAAHLSNDPVFIESCSRDIHTANACILFPDGADLIRSDPKGKGARFRDIAKTCGFAVAYGAEVTKIFGTLFRKGFDVSMDDVETMLDNLKSSYRVFYGWANGQVEFMRKHGFLRIPFSNRIRWVGHFAKPNLAFNTPVQGGVAGVMNKRLLLLEKRKTRNAKLIKYHYDAAIYETPVAECADMNRIIKEVWAEPVVVESNGLSFVQKIDQKEGERDSDF